MTESFLSLDLRPLFCAEDGSYKLLQNVTSYLSTFQKTVLIFKLVSFSQSKSLNNYRLENSF